MNGYVHLPVPHHSDIQLSLVRQQDKPEAFYKSQQWIGAIECGLVLKHLYHVDCKTLFVPSGEDVVSNVRTLSQHFDVQGTPIMIGGGVLAYGLLGVAHNQVNGQAYFLILDPHYTGSEDIKTIFKQGWCAWKKPDLFKGEYFYNFCLPQRPKVL